MLNALWSAGAEAVQMQDQRIIATSSTTAASETHCCSTAAPTAPYTITAVGDSEPCALHWRRRPLVRLCKQYVVRFGLGYDEQSGRRWR